jgi:hypothetical protein
VTVGMKMNLKPVDAEGRESTRERVLGGAGTIGCPRDVDTMEVSSRKYLLGPLARQELS